MKKLFTIILTITISFQISQAQTAMDFTMNDCNGVMHNCFTTLDSGKVIIMEFFMTCNMCISAGHQIEAMKEGLDMHYPGMIDFYQFGYTNSYSCATVTNWINSNGFNSVPFDSGAALVAYYGGFGMPTIAVVGGTNHEILYTGIGYASGDTADIAMAIHEFFNATGVSAVNPIETNVTIFPNPATDNFNMELNLVTPANVYVELVSLSGEVVATLLNEKMNAGKLQRTFSTESYAGGIYFIKSSVNNNTTFRKLTITR